MTHIPGMGELIDTVAKPLSIIFEKIWLSGKIPSDWEKGSIASVFKKERKKDLSNYRSVGLTLASLPFTICLLLASPFCILLYVSPFGFCFLFPNTLFTEAAGTPASILVYSEVILSIMEPNVTGTGQS